ncbi:MAG: hypothetical protein K8R48_06730 [Alphaproteobacteria bacterium]|nr:hypothetical protein [Alphaproteobacteria bacterium]
MSPTPLEEAFDESRFGGKAASLARSLRAGLPVPPGFALATTHVEDVFRGHAETMRNMRDEFIRLAGPCAVRSSAVGEDSEGASFAGQHITILNVRHESLLSDAVLKVRESAHTESARAYRRKLGMDETPRIGVVVQRMVEPDCAGVMFTKNPLTGGDERVIEAAWGLGEAVVGGLVIPDNHVLDAQGRVLRCIAGEKYIELSSHPEGGVMEKPVAEDRVSVLCLNEAMLAELHALAARCEACYGKGLDIEWAFAGDKLYLLQCRAITRNR